MFKNIAITLFSLITAPGDTWKRIAGKGENESLFLRNFFYPLLALAGIVVFLGDLVSLPGEGVQPALKGCIVAVVSTFVGLFLAAFLLEETVRLTTGERPERGPMRIFAGYCIAFPLTIAAIVSLMPDFAFLRIVQLYLFYLVWEGVDGYLHVPPAKRVLLTVLASLILLLSPFVIRKIMLLLMPGMED